MPQELASYLLECGPPSGGTLFAAPTQPRKRLVQGAPTALTFNNNPYTASCEMVRRAVRKAWPHTTQQELDRLGGGTPRKTMAQLLWSVTQNRRIVVDFGGWSEGKEQSAVDGYFNKTTDCRRSHRSCWTRGSCPQQTRQSVDGQQRAEPWPSRPARFTVGSGVGAVPLKGPGPANSQLSGPPAWASHRPSCCC